MLCPVRLGGGNDSVCAEGSEQCSEAGDRGGPPCRPAGKASIMSFVSDFLWGQVLGQLGDSRSLSSLAAAAAPPPSPFLEPFLWARYCAKHHMSCPIFISLIVQMWKLRPRLRKVSNLLTHNKQEEHRDLNPGPLCLLPKGRTLQNLPTPAFPSQALPGTCGLWSALSTGSESVNDLGHITCLPWASVHSSVK